MYRFILIVVFFGTAWATTISVMGEDYSSTNPDEIKINLKVALLTFTVSELGADYSELGGGGYVKLFDAQDESAFLNYSGDLMKGLFDYIWGFKGHFWQGYIGNLQMQVWVKKARSSLKNELQTSSPHEKVDLNGTMWYRSADAKNETIFYRTPLIGDKYLSVEFYFDDRSSNKSWEPKARNYVNHIVNSIKLVRQNKTGSEKSCC